MDYNQLFAISSAGLGLQRSRVEVATLNLANAHTQQSGASGPYQPLRVSARSVALAAARPGPMSFGATFGALSDQTLKQVPEARIEASGLAPRLVYQPEHPLADAQGRVAYPNVDESGEMVSLLDASNAYKANLMALHLGRSLAMKTLEIGGAA